MEWDNRGQRKIVRPVAPGATSPSFCHRYRQRGTDISTRPALGYTSHRGASSPPSSAGAEGTLPPIGGSRSMTSGGQCAPVTLLAIVALPPKVPCAMAGELVAHPFTCTLRQS